VLTDIILLAPYRRYLSNINNFFIKILYRLIFIILVFLGIALGFIAAPLYCGIKYLIVKDRFVKKFNSNNEVLKTL